MPSYSDYLKMQNYTANPAVDSVMFNQTGSFKPSNNSPMLYGDTPNTMDMMSDGYTNSGVPNMAGLSYGQSLGATAPSGGMSWGDRLSSSDFWLGGKDAKGMQTMGAAAPLMQGAGALMSGFLGMKQYGLSKKVFENNKQQFERNFDAQKGVTNSQLSDRQDRRNADARANGMTGTTSTADYMAKWGVK